MAIIDKGVNDQTQLFVSEVAERIGLEEWILTRWIREGLCGKFWNAKGPVGNQFTVSTDEARRMFQRRMKEVKWAREIGPVKFRMSPLMRDEELREEAL